MEKITCVVIGGGHAGIHAIKSIQKQLRRNQSIRIILIDPNPYHIKKVLLFKPIVSENIRIEIPWKKIFAEGVEVIQGAVTSINHANKVIRLTQANGQAKQLGYDIAVVAVGSTFQSVNQEKGGIPLISPEHARIIHSRWQENLQQAVKEANQNERDRLLTSTVVGAGISGIETASALSEKMREEAAKLGIQPEDISVYLINSKEKLFQEGPKKFSRKLARRLANLGVIVLHNTKVIKEEDGVIELDYGEPIPTGLCIWTIGLVPNQALPAWGIPLTEDGRIQVDKSYRVVGTKGLYSIGDCTRIFDPQTGREDTMTCKEATIQARRLGKIIHADIEQREAPIHKTPITTYCFGIGERQGLVWVRLPKINIYLSGKIGLLIRKITWDIASLVK